MRGSTSALTSALLWPVPPHLTVLHLDPLHSPFSHFIPNYLALDPNLLEADPQVTAPPRLCSCKPNATISFQCVTLPITKNLSWTQWNSSPGCLLCIRPRCGSEAGQIRWDFIFFFFSRWPAKHHLAILGAISVEVPPAAYPHLQIFGIQSF